jgi:cupin superfamily acireductone dioxygenase involved in methionine salvage
MKAYTLLQIEPENIEDFILEVFQSYDNHDIFEATKPFNLKSHYHSGIESRLFLEGEAVFTIYGEDVVCKKGTYIEIESNVIHSFSYDSDKPLKVMRFFSDNEDWKATFI